MADNYGVVTFDDHGPIKTWSRLAAVAAHNNRDKLEPHCDPAAPQPVHLCGGRDLVADVKARLLAHGIDPTKLRKNAAIAFEVVMTASRPFFTAGTYEEAMKRTGAWIGAACAFARKMWGENRIVSMVLHLDEFTPHIHVVLLPLIEKIYKRWPERGKTWALEARTISGPGMYQRVHDGYAQAMQSFGLARGKSGSRAKYRPYAAELADLDEQKRRAALAVADAAKAADEARQQAADAAAVAAEQLRSHERRTRELDARTKVIAKLEGAARQKVETQRAALRTELRRREVHAATAREERRAPAEQDELPLYIQHQLASQLGEGR